MDGPVILLPYQLDGVSLSKLASEVSEHALDGSPRELGFDFSTLGKVRPAGVVFLSNLVHWLAEKETNVEFLNVTGETEVQRFLDDALFFEQHCGQKIRSG